MDLPTGTVTFLFTDIEGSTRMLHALGREYLKALEAHSRIIETNVEVSNGIVVNTEGDAFFCVFANAIDAVAAAVAIQKDLDDHGWPSGGEIRVRMGIHTGDGTRGGRDYVGVDVHRAARISAAGHGGQVLLSAETAGLVRRALPEGVSLLDLGDHRLKDLPEPERLSQLAIPLLTSEFPALRSQGSRPHNLPASLDNFVGRSHALVDIRGRLQRSRLITLVGPGGTGKTRLAIEAGSQVLDEFEDGVWLVELASLSDPQSVPQALASALRLRERPGTPLTATISENLKRKSVLIILDNCEHLLTACATLSDRLLRECPGLRILATSREALRVPGEAVSRIEGLEVPAVGTADEELAGYEAVELFVDRARERVPDFGIAPETSRAVVHICRRLDGIPLAIELAAARVHALGVEHIAERLDDRFGLLTGGSPIDPRHQTLQLTMDWSYDLLDVAEAALLRCLSLFVGGFSLEAVESVCISEGMAATDVLDLLQSLVDKSLAIAEVHARSVRYRLLETVRAYSETTWPARATFGKDGTGMLRITCELPNWPSRPSRGRATARRRRQLSTVSNVSTRTSELP